MAAKKPAPKKAPAKKPAAKPAPKKAAPAKKPAAKPAPKKGGASKDSKRVYHLSKRAEDGKWVVKFAGGDKVIKTFATQKEGLDFCNKMADNQDGTVLVHASKGAKKGKIK